jgi:hypothetical protein
MTNDLAVSMAELEGESAELLPSRETLNVCHHRYSGGSSYTSITNVSQGNTEQFGLLNVSALNGNNVNILGIANQL